MNLQVSGYQQAGHEKQQNSISSVACPKLRRSTESRALFERDHCHPTLTSFALQSSDRRRSWHRYASDSSMRRSRHRNTGDRDSHGWRSWHRYASDSSMRRRGHRNTGDRNSHGWRSWHRYAGDCSMRRRGHRDTGDRDSHRGRSGHGYAGDGCIRTNRRRSGSVYRTKGEHS